MTDIRCPEGKKDDQVQKVSGIVAASTSFYSVTNLGVSLSPPDKPYLVRYPPTSPTPPTLPTPPIQPTKSSIKGINDEPIVFWSGIIFGAVLGTGLCALLGFHFDLAPIAASLIVAILAGVGMGAIVQNGIKKSNLKNEIERSKRAFEQAMTQYQQDDLAYKKAQPEYLAKMAESNRLQMQYDAALLRWNELYYCHRHDGAFLPDGRSLLIPRDQIRSFCGFP